MFISPSINPLNAKHDKSFFYYGLLFYQITVIGNEMSF